jgi:hypothetical protein
MDATAHETNRGQLQEEENYEKFDIVRDYILSIANQIPYRPTEMAFYDFLRTLLPDIIVTEGRIMKLFEFLIQKFSPTKFNW